MNTVKQGIEVVETSLHSTITAVAFTIYMLLVLTYSAFLGFVEIME